MALNLKVFSANYKLCATNYNVKGASHDGRNLRATAPFLFYAFFVLLLAEISKGIRCSPTDFLMKMLTAVDMLMPMESQNFSKSFFKSASTRKGFRVGSHLMIQSRYVFASRVSLSDESPVFFDSRFLVDGPSIDGVLGASSIVVSATFWMVVSSRSVTVLLSSPS